MRRPACVAYAPLAAPVCTHFDRLVLRTRATTSAGADTPGRAGSLASEHATDAAQRAKLKPDEVPDLIVFSDMQFDQAHEGSWETHHERLQRTWAEKGYELPTITYWNLRGDTAGGYMADASTPGVRLLSGFSPALLKLVLTGEEADEDEVETVDGVTKARPTPYQTMRRALDAPRYDAVRAMLSEFDGAPFADYTFTPAPEDFVVVKVDIDTPAAELLSLIHI